LLSYGTAPGYTTTMPSSQTLLLLATVLALAIFVVVLKWLNRGAAPLPYYSREFLLSKGELAFFRILRLATPADLMIAMKVRLADLINCPPDAWKAGFFGRISQKHVDFVLVDIATTAIALVIELDDRSHRQAARRDRDAFVDRALAAAGITILHVTAASNYNMKQLRQTIAGCLARSQVGA
jgi:hypothetical protein